MVTIKEAMEGKKVECHKCKDKFIAERPDDEEEEVQVKPKKGAKSAAVSAKPMPPSRKGKPSKKNDDEDEVEDIEEIEEIDEDEDDAPRTKSKNKNAAKSSSKKSSPKDEDDDDTPKKKSSSAGGNRLTMGLVLAGVGVVILVIAAIFVMRGGRTSPGPVAQGVNPDDGDKKPEVKPGGEGTKKKIIIDNNPKTNEVWPRPLDANEIARLTNLLPNDTEHVFHVYYGNLFTGNSPLKDAIFHTSGPPDERLDDRTLRRKLGFALQSVDDVIVAEKFSPPSWKYTIIHFSEVVKDEDIQDALNLTPAKTEIEGQNYYTMQSDGHPWFDPLSRIQVGIPAALRAFGSPSKGSLVRLHNPQTLIVGDEAPVKAFLRAKGQFPLLSGAKVPASASRDASSGRPNFVSFSDLDQLPPGGGAVGGGTTLATLDNTVWIGTEGPNNDRLRVVVSAAGKVVVESTKGGGEGFIALTPPAAAGGLPTITVTCPTSDTTYVGTGDVASKSITGKGMKAGESWTFTLKLAQPDSQEPKVEPKMPPQVDPLPAPARDEKYSTIKAALRKTLDTLEARSADGKDKLLFSSVTDMDANRVETTNPDFANQIVRRPRQFWDVTQILPESKPRIRNLGTVLIMRDTLRYQLVNEVTCAQELDAKEFEKELLERGAAQVARFIQAVTRHEVRTPRPPEAKPAEPMVGGLTAVQPPEEKKSESVLSQILLAQRENVIEFQLELVLDSPALKEIQSLASLVSSTLRAEMDWLALGKGRHTLGQAVRLLGEKGLSSRNVEPGRYPPGAFPRPETTSRIDMEPKNRVSFMAGLLPYLGHQNLFNRIQFNRSWRDSSNWFSGNTIVPQFLDPMYPDTSRFVSFGELPMEFAATHYVGIAGVGMDAASFKRSDPATFLQRGVLSYDESAPLDEVRQGRGLSNTILLIQTPHDGLTGVSPWIAGGGATLRGVPEKNSILPFVLTTDKNGKPIHNKNKRGTFALMTDGSVRFIDQNVSDGVFKAMCTVNGPAPVEFNLNQDPNTPMIPVPDNRPAKKEVPAEKKAPVKTEPKKTESEPKKTEPPQKKASRDEIVVPGDAVGAAVSAACGLALNGYKQSDQRQADISDRAVVS